MAVTTRADVNEDHIIRIILGSASYTPSVKTIFL